MEEAGLTEGPVLNAGDTVAYGESPEECVQYVRARPKIISVQGNYDKNVALFPKNSAEYRRKWGKTRPEKYEALRQDSEVISAEARAWLGGLPKEVTLTLAGTQILVTHYAPGVKEGIGTWTTDARLSELAAQTEAQVVVCGHTHTPFVRTAGGVLFVNPGTAGRSFFDRHRASYAVLTLDPGAAPGARLHQVRIL